MLKFVNIQNVIFEINTETKVIKPMDTDNINVLYKSEHGGVTHRNFYDFIIVIDKDKTWMKSIPVPIFIEHIMAHIDPSYATEYIKDKKEFKEYRPTVKTKKEEFKEFKCYWIDYVNLPKIILDSISLMLHNSVYNWKLTDLSQRAEKYWQVEAKVTITNEDFESLEEQVGDTKGNVYFKSYLPAMKVAGFTFPENTEPSLKNAYYGFMSAFEYEIQTRGLLNPWIAFKYPQDVLEKIQPLTIEQQEELKKPVDFNQLGRKYLVYNKGEYFVNDYRYSKRHMSIRDFLLDIACAIDDCVLNKTIYEKERKAVTNRGEFKTYKCFISKEYSDFEENKINIDYEPYEITGYDSEQIRIAVSKCDEDYKKELSRFDVRKTDLYIFLYNLCGYIRQQKDIECMYDVVYNFSNTRLNDRSVLEKARKALTHVYSEDVVKTALDTLSAVSDNTELPTTKKVNISLARIGEDIGSTFNDDIAYELISGVLFSIDRNTGNITIPSLGRNVMTTVNMPNYNTETNYLYNASLVIHDKDYTWYRKIPADVLFTRLGKHYRNEKTQKAVAERNQMKYGNTEKVRSNNFWSDYYFELPFESFEFIQRFLWNLIGDLNYKEPMLSSFYRYIEYKDFDKSNAFYRVEDKFKVERVKALKKVLEKYYVDLGLLHFDICDYNFEPIWTDYAFYKRDNVPMHLPERYYHNCTYCTESLVEGEPGDNFFNYPEKKSIVIVTGDITKYISGMLEDLKTASRYIDKCSFEMQILDVENYKAGETYIPAHRYKVTEEFLRERIALLTTCLSECDVVNNEIFKDFSNSRIFVEQVFALVTNGKEDLIEKLNDLRCNLSDKALQENINTVKGKYPQEIVSKICGILKVDLNTNMLDNVEEWL